MKTVMQELLEWFRKYSEQNGTPTPFEIRCQMELALEKEKQQIIEAFNSAKRIEFKSAFGEISKTKELVFKHESGQDYFNQTYKTKENDFNS